jgi:hypothetical protein
MVIHVVNLPTCLSFYVLKLSVFIDFGDFCSYGRGAHGVDFEGYISVYELSGWADKEGRGFEGFTKEEPGEEPPIPCTVSGLLLQLWHPLGRTRL